MPDIAFYIIISTGIFLFAVSTLLTLYCAIRFHKNLTHAVALFYFVTTATLALRTIFFISILTGWSVKTRAILLVLPGTLTLSIGLTQVNVYLQLILRIQAIQAGELLVGSEGDKRLKWKENAIFVVIYLLMSFYPILFVSEFMSSYTPENS